MRQAIIIFLISALLIGGIYQVTLHKKQRDSRIEYISQGDYEEDDGVLYFIISEFGIKIPVDKSLRDNIIYYYLNSTDDGFSLETTKFSLKQLNNLGGQCSVKEGPKGEIIRFRSIPWGNTLLPSEDAHRMVWNGRLLPYYAIKDNSFLGYRVMLNHPWLLTHKFILINNGRFYLKNNQVDTTEWSGECLSGEQKRSLEEKYPFLRTDIITNDYYFLKNIKFSAFPL